MTHTNSLNGPTIRPSGVRFRMLGWLFAAAMSGYLCRNCIGVAEEDIRADLHLTEIQSGWLMGAFFWTYALLQVPAGEYCKARGTRWVLFLCAIGWSAGIIAIGGSYWLLTAVVAQLVMGASQAGLFPCAVQSLRVWFPPQRRAIASGALVAGMQVGAILASIVTASLIARDESGNSLFDWRTLFICYGVLSLLWASGFWRWFVDRPADHPLVNAAERQFIAGDEPTRETAAEESAASGWGRILTNPSVWFLCLQQVFRASGYIFFATWFPTFLKEVHEVDTKESGYLQGTVFAATLVGSLFSGAVQDFIYSKTKNLRLSRQGLGIVAMAVCCALILGAFFVDNVIGAVALIAGGAFAAAFAGPCAYTCSIDIGGQHVARVFGLMNMSGNFAAAITPAAVGWYFSEFENWNGILFIFATIYALATVCWMLVDPTRQVESAH